MSFWCLGFYSESEHNNKFFTKGIAMDMIGILRSLQSELVTAVGFFLFFTLIYLVIRFKVDLDSDEKKFATKTYVVLVVLIIGCVGYRIVNYSLINRMPRSDTNRSGVFQQMEAIEKRSEKSE